MKDHLPERFISAAWLGILAYFFIYGSAALIQDVNPQLVLFTSVVLTVFYSIFGYIRGYKIFLLPADYYNSFQLRCVTSIWLAFLFILISLFIYSLHFTTNESINLGIMIAMGTVGFLIGWLFLYRLLQLPKATYFNEFPDLTQRVISALWFASIGYLLAFMILRTTTLVIPFFVFLLSSYLGFFYGYRIILLSTSIKGFVKSVILGFVGTSYALLIIFLMFAMTELLKPFTFSINNIMDFLGGFFAWIIFMFPLTGLFICTIGIISSVLLYLLSRPWAD